MRSPLTYLMRAKIGTQIAILVLTSLILAQLVMATGFFLLVPRPPHPNENVAIIEKLSFLARMLDGASSSDARAVLIQSAQRVDSELSNLQSVPPAATDQLDMRISRAARDRVGGHSDIFIARRPHPDGQLIAVARLTDGTAIATPLAPSITPFMSPFAIGTLLFLGTAITVLSLWAARQVTAPLGNFADAAERFQADGSNVSLVETGAAEVRKAAKALNDMQQRISRLIADRTRMLAAVGHDLRTPITRLRLRAEDIENGQLRLQFIRDLGSMQNLVQSALSFLRGQVEPGPKTKTDLPTLVQTVCDNLADMGGNVCYKGTTRIYVVCEPNEILRAVENLIDNGLKFGGSVAVRVEQQADTAIIDIQDEGPGIPDAEKLRVMEPFYRGDSARNLDAGDSFGLGLSIAQAIVERNGGSLELMDALPKGLLVRIRLPVSICADTEPNLP